MDLWQSLAGMVRCRLISGDIHGALETISGAGIPLHDITLGEDTVTAEFFIPRADVKQVRSFCRRKGYDLHIIRLSGLFWPIRRLLGRPVLLVGMVILLLLSIYVPGRVFFIRIEGNVRVPTNLILEKSMQCGIGFGASRREVRSEKVKNALLSAIPELQWAGVNTSGCLAIIRVQERPVTESNREDTGITSIVASMDGVITGITVTRGNGLCTVGQAVKKGQLLISGYTDCGISIKADRAEGEVYAQTRRKLTAVLPTEWMQSTEITVVSRKYALVIGKKRINFYKDSGILDSSCGKMYSESYVTLPGGFILPIKLVCEVWEKGVPVSVTAAPEDISAQLKRFSEYYLKQQMAAGALMDRSEEILEGDAVLCLQGEYACIEMIGQVRNEEIVNPNGKYD